MTTPIDLVRQWASDANFNSGPDTGQPTKVDPGVGVAAQGYVSGLPFNGAHANHQLNAIAEATRGLQQSSALLGMQVVNQETVMSSVFELSATHYAAFDTWLLQTNTQNLYVHGMPTSGATLGVTSNSAAMATDQSYNVIAIEDSGTGLAFRAVGSAGSFTNVTTDVLTAIGEDVERVVYDEDRDEFLACARLSTTVIGVSTASPPTTWDTPTAGTDVFDICHRSGGKSLVAQGVSGSVTFRIAGADNTSWSDTGGTIPSAGSEVTRGRLASISGLYIYASEFAGDTCRVHVSADGAAWTLAQTLTLPSTLTGVEILTDFYSGAIYVVLTGGGFHHVYCSLDVGTTWFGPLTSPTAGWAAAGGHLWSVRGTVLFRSSVRLPAAV